MGVIISTTELSPLSVASITIGIVSFAFTLGTFFKVVWVNLTTLGEAPHEVHSYLTNLRTELLEERANLRGMRRGMRRFRKMTRRYDLTGMSNELDETIWKTMDDTLRSCIKRFKTMERPFLAEGEHGISDAPGVRRRRRRGSMSPSPPRYSHAAYSSPPEKEERDRRHRSRARGAGGGGGGDGNTGEQETSWDREDDDEAFWAQRCKYAPFTLGLRFRWLGCKSEAQSLQNDLTRLQLRRVARQVAGITTALHEFGMNSFEVNDMVKRIDDRVSRVIGIRRVPDDD